MKIKKNVKRHGKVVGIILPTYFFSSYAQFRSISSLECIFKIAMKVFSESLEKKEKDCENSRMFQIHDSQDVALEDS